jgi:hypothetical protein
MARIGRARWSTRIVVEDCLAFDIANLVRSGVFRAKHGSLCSVDWKDLNGQVTFCAHFWVESTADGKILLHISHGVPSGIPLLHYARSATIEIVETPLHFGPRPWFLCPGVHNNAPCRKRVRILYFSPTSGGLGCRKCLNLIHRSTKQHDKRVDAMAKLSPLELRQVLLKGSTRQKLLAIRASSVLLRHLRKKMARYKFFGQGVSG